MSTRSPFRKAACATSLIFALAVAAALLVVVMASRSYVERQLGAQAQEAATGLAKTLESAMDDRVTVGLLTSVLFDRGQLASISVVASDGRQLAYRELPSAVPGVPGWFTALVALDPPATEAMVTARWRQLGRVIVRSQPCFAYAQLWHTVLGILAVLIGAYVSVMATLWRYVPRAAPGVSADGLLRGAHVFSSAPPVVAASRAAPRP